LLLDAIGGQVILGIANQVLERSKPIPQNAVIQKQDALLFTLIVKVAADDSAHSQEGCALVDQHYDYQIE